MANVRAQLDQPADPAEIAEYFDRLWPILRSITGPGVRRTHDILGELIPLERIEVPSGTAVFDWTVPLEWVPREAYVITPDGRRILDVAENNLHLVNYSVPYRGRVTREELDTHLHSLPDRPKAIPYITSYYQERWGFCISQEQRDSLPDGEYDVVVKTELIDGSLTVSEAVLPGDEPSEILFSTDTCHPSLANNELSGPLVTAFLYRRLAAMPRRRFTYRFAFLPETIGAIVYLARYGEGFRDNLRAGYVVSCVGTDAPFTYKRSRRGDTEADRAAIWTMERFRGNSFKVIDFNPASGSDERQYCSPAFNLPVGSLMRSVYGTYPEYHTSLDNRELVSFEAMSESVEAYYRICETLELNGRFQNLIAECEPQLGKRGLYASIGGAVQMAAETAATLWMLNYSDGKHDLLGIAEKSGQDIRLLAQAAEKCVKAGIARRL